MINATRRLHAPIAMGTRCPQRARGRRDERGQATTEYALILLVAAVIATLVIAWATFGGGAGRIGELFDSVFDSILQRAQTDVE